MTQTLPTTAIVGRSYFTGLIGLTTLPMTSVELAREEFGASLADAQAFVLTTCCTECGMDADAATSVLRECYGCGAQGCDCLVAEDAHGGDAFFCDDCRPVCGGYCCND